MYVPVIFDEGMQASEIESRTMTFQSLGLREAHLEEFLRQNIDLVTGEDETLLVVGQQVRNSSRGVSDLTAIDADGNIVLIEIKRDASDISSRREPFEFQAVRYAASYAKIETPEELVELVYSAYIEQHRDEYQLGSLTPAEKARRELLRFLESNDALRTFNGGQRIILIASAFDDQTLSAVAWMIANGVDINALTVTPIFIGEQGFLNIEKILPPTSLADFYVGLAEASSVVAVTRTPRVGGSRQYLPRMDKLFEWGLVRAGDRLRIRSIDDACATAIDERTVNVNGQQLSYNQWGQQATGWSSINIYEWAVKEETGKTLDDLRREKMAEMEEEE